MFQWAVGSVHKLFLSMSYTNIVILLIGTKCPESNFRLKMTVSLILSLLIQFGIKKCLVCFCEMGLQY